MKKLFQYPKKPNMVTLENLIVGVVCNRDYLGQANTEDCDKMPLPHTRYSHTKFVPGFYEVTWELNAVLWAKKQYKSSRINDFEIIRYNVSDTGFTSLTQRADSTISVELQLQFFSPDAASGRNE